MDDVKPALRRPIALITRDLRGLLTPLTRPFDKVDEYTLNQLLSELDILPTTLPEGADLTTPINLQCRVWHGNDFAQCELPKGHSGKHLCVMRWEWEDTK